MSDELAIDVRGLVKRFGSKTAVGGVDIQMPRGEVWGFLGPNGSGKTTTIRMICGLLRASEGEGQCLAHPGIVEWVRFAVGEFRPTVETEEEGPEGP